MAGIVGRHGQYFLDPPRDERDVKNVGVHRRNGEQPDEPVLDDGTIPRVAALLPAGLLAHHDDVGIGAVAQEARHGGLSKHQQIPGFTELGQHLGTQSCDAQSA